MNSDDDEEDCGNDDYVSVFFMNMMVLLRDIKDGDPSIQDYKKDFLSTYTTAIFVLALRLSLLIRICTSLVIACVMFTSAIRASVSKS
uniref:Uncharacterized protein n=1 Tax=Glossina palpalis gambiensis TaxID=67801 RepID=A0A1B0BRX7_9MUSC